MPSIDLEVRNPSGLHARPATLFVETAASFQSRITVENLDRGSPAVDAKSVLFLLIQQAVAGFRSKVTIEGLDTGTAPISAGTMIGLVSAGIRNGEHVRVAAEGPDEADALEAIRSLLEAGVCHP